MFTPERRRHQEIILRALGADALSKRGHLPLQTTRDIIYDVLSVDSF
jgi:hypothetical protein